MMIDLGTGNNNKINWPMNNKQVRLPFLHCAALNRFAQEFIDILEVIYRGARKGRGLVVSPKDYSRAHQFTICVAISNA